MISSPGFLHFFTENPDWFVFLFVRFLILNYLCVVKTQKT